MVLENLPVTLDLWFPAAVRHWLIMAVAVSLAFLIFGYLVAAAINGPIRAGDMTYRLVSSALVDVFRLSPRRVFALARLAIQESLRRRVLAGLAIFIIILAFAVWFLDTTSTDPAKLFLSFVLNAATYLVLLMVLFLSAFSLPNDIKNHTIYTIVTKPVRPSEIVLGRIVGFAAVGTGLLVIMGLFSYVFAVRALNHTHDLTAADLTEVSSASAATKGERTGQTGLARNHRHPVSVRPNGTGATDIEQGHWHEITTDGDRLVVGPPQGQFHARMPIYGSSLIFLDSGGTPTEKGINVGNEWTYRSYIEGGTRAAGVWRFRGLRREDFPDGLRMNMTISVFRTHKGNIEQTVLGSYTLRNPRTNIASPAQNFFAKEFAIDDRTIPLKFQAQDGRTIDVFDDLVDDGELEIELNCLQGGQYFGMARPDLYLLPREGSFEANFVKGYVSIWLQMLLVASLGVMWSTFLNGAVAMLATTTTLIFGMFIPWMQDLAAGKVVGGGGFEALLRIVTQTSIGTPLDETLATNVVQWLDRLGRLPLAIISNLIPNFANFSDTTYVAQGFNIPDYLVVEQALTAFGLVIPIFLIGLICLKMREVAK